jgi:hypothetical protein
MHKYMGIYYEVRADGSCWCNLRSFIAEEPNEEEMKAAIEDILDWAKDAANLGEEESE